VENKWETDDILILGDLNADCSYASNKARKQLKLRTDSRFDWLIDDDVDTTTTSTDCTYDRCVVCLIIFTYTVLANLHCYCHTQISVSRCSTGNTANNVLDYIRQTNRM